MKKSIISASVMCADVLNLGKELKEMEKSGIDMLHCDIMDNAFVPNIMMPTDYINRIAKATTLPLDVHIMAYNPDTIIANLNLKENDVITVHYESTPHLERAIDLIKKKGCRAGVALNPATALCNLDSIIGEVDLLLIMTVNPGFAGQKMVPNGLEKIAAAKKYLKEKNLKNVIVEVDGNCSFENSPKMKKAGADILVAGTSSVFGKGLTISEGTAKLRKVLGE